jgi:hypothetical protein
MKRGTVPVGKLALCAAIASALSHTGHQSYMHMHLKVIACSICVLVLTTN